jgi:SH3-like domain-containing protein
LATGNHAVYVASKPYQAWLAVRSADGMPGFVDRAIIDGRSREIVWMPSVYPPKGSAGF